MYWTCGQCCLLCMWVVCSKIMVGLSVLDMWSVFFVMYVGGMIKYSDWNERTGYVVSVLCSIYRCWDLI